jgi:hypothetical protein
MLQAALQILSYFVRNPSAIDSLEGIAKWRLLEEAIHRNVLETEQALEWLVQQGYLLERPETKAVRLYSLNVEKRAEAESLLHAEGQPSPTGDKVSIKDKAK